MTTDAFLAAWGPMLAIAGMAAVTYLWRIGGFFLMGFVKPHPRITRALAALPGSVILATILPILAKSGAAALLALAIAVALTVARKSDFVACTAGLSAAILARIYGL